jgi:hypothetical protein
MAMFTSAALRTLKFLERARRETVGLTNLPRVSGPGTIKALEARGYLKVSIELTDRGRRELRERAAREARETRARGTEIGVSSYRGYEEEVVQPSAG